MCHVSFPLKLLLALIPVTVMASAVTPGDIVSASSITQEKATSYFVVSPISNDIFSRINNKSWKEICHHDRKDFRYVTALHYDGKGQIRLGELIVHQSVAKEVLDILKELYIAKYPIEKMVLIDNYGADDELSMTANNSSAFNCRVVKGSKKLSAHARGMAVDINPLYNPYVKVKNGQTIVQPEAGRPWIVRNATVPYKIDENDLAYKLFKKHGWEWGGDWKSLKDYQHFEKAQ